MPDEPAPHRDLDDEPDPHELWRWVGAAVRPWLGWILIGVGALLMLLGYLGVSREALPGKQIPYLVSGGVGGMFLAVLGAYFLGTQELRRDSGRLDRLEQMVQDLHLALLRRPDAPDPTVLGNGAAGADAEAERAPARQVVAVEGGDLFHRRSCAVVEGKDATSLTPGAARKAGLRPCPACAPAGQRASRSGG
jgi:hypothetical protein